LGLVWRGNGALLVSANIFLGLGYGRSGENPADDPSRLKRVRGPSGQVPKWLSCAIMGYTLPLERVWDALPVLKKGEAQWVRLTIALCEPDWMASAPLGWSVRSRPRLWQPSKP